MMDQEASKKVFDNAKRLFDEGHVEDALKQLTILNQEHPDVFNIQYPMLKCLQQLGRVDEMKELCDRMSKRFKKEKYQARLKKAKSYLEKVARHKTESQTDAKPSQQTPIPIPKQIDGPIEAPDSDGDSSFDETPSPEETSDFDDMPSPEETSDFEPTPAPEQTVDVEQTPSPEKTPEIEKKAAVEKTLPTDTAPSPKEVPDKDAPKPTLKPVIDKTGIPVETPYSFPWQHALLIALIILGVCGGTLGAFRLWSALRGAPTFSADIKIARPNDLYEGRFYYKDGQHSRAEMMNRVFIVNGGNAHILLPDENNYATMEVAEFADTVFHHYPFPRFGDFTEWLEKNAPAHLGSGTINRFACDIYHVDIPIGEQEVVTSLKVWYARFLRFPIKVEVNLPDSTAKIILTLENIEISEQPEHLFTLPPAYEQIAALEKIIDAPEIVTDGPPDNMLLLGSPEEAERIRQQFRR